MTEAHTSRPESETSYNSEALLERKTECDAIDTALARLRRGHAGLIVFEGATGVGKSSLVGLLRHRAADLGAHVLHARGGEFEAEFAFGVVRQLLERWMITAPADERSAVLTGSAALAAPVFDCGSDEFTGFQDCSALDKARRFHGLLHGLHWLCVNLADRAPLVVTVDDAQWSDLPSLHFLSYLASRLDGTRILLAVARRSDEPGVGTDVIQTLALSPLARVIRPTPLSDAATAELVAALLGRRPAGTWARTCHEVTGGNPLLLRELLAEVTLHGIEPVDSQAGRLHDIAPATVTYAVTRRLGGLPADATQLVRALAGIRISEPVTDVRQAAAVAELDEGRAAEMAQLLVAVGILRAGHRLEFVHPIIATAVHHDMPLSVRDRLHSKIARTAGRAPVRIAAHLTWVQPASDPWVVRVLCQAGREARTAGDVDVAIGFLRRAMAEPPPGELRGRVLAELGTAELYARAPQAVDHLDEAVRWISEPVQRATTGIGLAWALVAAARYDEAAELLTRLATDVEPHDDELALRLRIHLVSVDQLYRGVPNTCTALVPRLDTVAPGDRPVHRLVQAKLALEALDEGAPAVTTAQRAEAVLAAAPVDADDETGVESRIVAAWTLALCDRLPEAERALAAAERDAAGRPTMVAEVATAVRAQVCFDQGKLADAEATARSVLASCPPGTLRGPGVPLATAVLVETLIERDELDEAAQELQRFGLRDDGPESHLLVPLLRARGRLRIHQGHVDEGLWDLLECRRHETTGGCSSPHTVSTVSQATLALARLGLQEEARTLAAEAVGLARAYGTARHLGVALRAAGLVAGGRAGLSMLERSARHLEDSPAVLEHAHTLVQLGGALRRADQRSSARRHLRSGVELAERCGAVALCRQADSELLAAGVRARRGSSRAPSLTPRERHVAGMAAEGMRNQEIAHTLFVTVKTVEWHLSQAYRKLGICSRNELQRALATARTANGH